MFEALENKKVVRTIYLSSLFLSGFSLVATVVIALTILNEVVPGMGNGGAFLISVLFSVMGVGILLMTLFGLICGSLGYIYQDVLPNRFIYKFMWPLILITSGVICFICITFLLIESSF